MADGSIVINTQLDSGNVNRELRALQREIRGMSREMELTNRRAMQPFKIQMMEARRNMMQLSQTMGTSTQTTAEFMGSVQQLGAEHKRASDAMINANRMIAASMIQTAGQMLNMSTQASKISANYERMANPMYQVNRAGLAIADSLNQMANRGNSAVLALRMLGPNASMKALYDMQMMINQGLMRFQMVAMAAMVTGVLVYGALHKAAMEANEGYKQSFETMTANIRKAFEPMVQVFAMVMGKVWDFINAIAEMAIKFNEAHPVLAKIIQGIMMLIPALILILSPLAIGIGLWSGLLAAWSSIWMLMGPLITGMAAMSGTVLLVAAAIVGLVAGINYLWKTNEGFRNAVIGAWDAIKAKAVEVFGFVAAIAKPAIEGIINAFETLKTAIMSAFSGDFSQLTAIFANIVPSIIGLLVGGIPGLIISASRFIPAISEGIMSNASTLSTTINEIVARIVVFLETQLPVFVQQGVQIITNIVQGIASALPIIVGAITNIITSIVPVITQMLPVLLKAGISILEAIINGILTLIPTLLDTALMLVTTIIDVIVKNIPVILKAGIDILNALIDGIVSILPTLIKTTLELILTIVNAITKNLPKILDAGIEILLSLIDGIIKILPELIDTAILLVNTIIKMVIDNLPKILDAGIEILMALIDGIIEVLPQLIDCAIDLIIKVVDTLIDNLPKIIDAGIELLMALIDGIIEVLPELVDAAIELIIKVAETLIENLPKIIDAGIELILALIDGLIDAAPQIWDAVKNDIIPKITDALEEVDWMQLGKDIVTNIADGLSNTVDKATDAIKKLASSLYEAFKEALGINSPSKVFFKATGSITEGIVKRLNQDDLTSLGKNAFKGFADGAMNTLETMKGFLNGGIPVDFKPGSGVQQWAGIAKQALMMEGQYSEANLQRLLMQMQSESGGNPRAINLWDSNAKKGTPSKGLTK